MILFYLVMGLALGSIIYLLFRNGWVYNRRSELCQWYFHSKESTYDGKTYNYAYTFDDTFHSYHEWLYKYWWCWNPAKIAGLKKWIV